MKLALIPLFGCAALLLYWIVFNHAVLNGWYFAAMAILALLAGWILGGHRKGK